MKSQLRSHVAKEEKASRSVGTAEAKDESGDPIFRGFIGGNVSASSLIGRLLRVLTLAM